MRQDHRPGPVPPGPPIVQPYLRPAQAPGQREDQLGRATGPSSSRPLVAFASILAVVVARALRVPRERAEPARRRHHRSSTC
ncbi:MAG: hypothetical protein M0C28_07545 [Candidatus Moduliflexus flocculans]|nr:hypothetical protein [Candidatus Moduliflexus flocculans]